MKADREEGPQVQHPIMAGLDGGRAVDADALMATRTAWGIVADALAEAVTTPGLPAEEVADLLRAHRAAAAASGRPLLRSLAQA